VSDGFLLNKGEEVNTPQKIDLKEDGVFLLNKEITSAEDLINNISIIEAHKNGLFAITRHYNNNWYLYIRKEK